MSTGLPAVLATLRDVPGITGSFAFLDDGQILCRDLPPLFSDELLCDIAPRVIRLAEAFAAGGDEATSCVLRFRDHQLVVRRLRYARLCVLGTAEVDAPALRMAVNVVARRIDNAFFEGTRR